MSEFYKLERQRIDPPEPGEFGLVTAAVWACALCSEPIDGMDGPGDGEVCIPCGHLMKAGRLRGVVQWSDDARAQWARLSGGGSMTPPRKSALDAVVAAARKFVDWSGHDRYCDYDRSSCTCGRDDLLFALAHLDSLPSESEGWRPIESAPKDGTPILVARYMGAPWGWVRGTAYWSDVRGIAGWIARGITEPPGELGLGVPDLWMPFPCAPSPGKGEPRG